MVAFGVLALILQHAVATELDVLHPGGQLDGGLLLLFGLYFLYFRQRLCTCGDGRQRYQRNQTE